MPKDRAEVQDQYKIGGGQLNEYEFDINKGAVEGQQQSAEGLNPEGLQGAAEPGLPQNVAERIRQVEEAARRKVERRKGGGETRAVSGRGEPAQKGGAKKRGGASKKAAAKKAAAKKGGAKKAAAKKRAEKSGTINRGSKAAKKAAAKKAGTKGAGKRMSNAGASKKGSAARKSPAKGASKGARTQAGGGGRSSG